MSVVLTQELLDAMPLKDDFRALRITLDLLANSDPDWHARTTYGAVAKRTGIDRQTVKNVMAKMRYNGSIKVESDRTGIDVEFKFLTIKLTTFSTTHENSQQSVQQQIVNPNSAAVYPQNYPDFYTPSDRERFKEEIRTSQALMSSARSSFGIDPATYLTLAEKIFSEWEFTGEKDWNRRHFFYTMRNRYNELRKNEADRKPTKSERAAAVDDLTARLLADARKELGGG